MPSDLIPHKEWLKRTSVLGRFRSAELKAIDEALLRYERFGGGDAHWRLEKALDAWKKRHGSGDEWKKSSRNKDHAVEQLTVLLGGGTDTDSAWGVVPDFMHESLVNARLGVLYLFGNLSVNSNVFNVVLQGGIGVTKGALGYAGASTASGGLGQKAASAASSTLTTAMIPSSRIFDAMESSAYTASGNPALAALGARVKTWLEEFARKVWSALKEKFGSVDATLATIKNLVNVCASIFLQSAAPFISAGMNMGKGLVNTLDAAFVRFRSWMQEKKVDIANGHPAVIVDSIHRAMTMSLFEGLYEMLKGASSAALTAATAGAAMVVNILVALGEMLIKVIWRLVEISKMRKFFEQARSYWDNRLADDALHRRPFAFTKWFREHALNLPALSTLALNTGICGDKMVYLSMYTPGGQQITTQQFQDGTRFLDNLKSWGAEYLGRCGYAFDSSSEMVGKLLVFAKSHENQRNAVWKRVRQFANA